MVFKKKFKTGLFLIIQYIFVVLFLFEKKWGLLSNIPWNRERAGHYTSRPQKNSTWSWTTCLRYPFRLGNIFPKKCHKLKIWSKKKKKKMFYYFAGRRQQLPSEGVEYFTNCRWKCCDSLKCCCCCPSFFWGEFEKKIDARAHFHPVAISLLMTGSLVKIQIADVLLTRYTITPYRHWRANKRCHYVCVSQWQIGDHQKLLRDRRGKN